MQHNQFMPELYPREYRPSTSSRFGKYFLGAILILIGSATVTAASAGFIKGTVHFELFAVLFGVFLFIALFGIYLIIKMLRLKITLTDSEMIIRQIFNTQILQRRHIESFHHEGIIENLVTTKICHADSKKIKTLKTMEFEFDEDYFLWFCGITNAGVELPREISYTEDEYPYIDLTDTSYLVETRRDNHLIYYNHVFIKKRNFRGEVYDAEDIIIGEIALLNMKALDNAIDELKKSLPKPII